MWRLKLESDIYCASSCTAVTMKFWLVDVSVCSTVVTALRTRICNARSGASLLGCNRRSGQVRGDWKRKRESWGGFAFYFEV